MSEATETVLSMKLAIDSLNEAMTAITEDAPADAVAQMQTRIDYYKQAIRELDRYWKQVFMEWLDKNRELEIGDTRYYVGTKKKVVSGDTARLLEALLESTGGDFEKVSELLSSQPFKHGACRGVLEDKWDEHFSELVEQDVKTGKPKREIKSVDPTFLRPSAR